MSLRTGRTGTGPAHEKDQSMPDDYPEFEDPTVRPRYSGLATFM